MKTILPLLITLIMAATGCQKQHTCSCNVYMIHTPTFKEHVRTEQLTFTGKKTDAKAYCDNQSRNNGFLEHECTLQ